MSPYFSSSAILDMLEHSLNIAYSKQTKGLPYAGKQNSHGCFESFCFNGTQITKSPYAKFLGMTIDENLTWKQHVNELRNSLLKYIGIFYHISGILPVDTAVQIYYSFVYCRLSYAIEVYGTACATVLKPLQTIQAAY